ncbi:MAG: hypothetical protein RL398_1861 [Planctomycetota bacterium]|jgi:hypothetical protein
MRENAAVRGAAPSVYRLELPPAEGMLGLAILGPAAAVAVAFFATEYTGDGRTAWLAVLLAVWFFAWRLVARQRVLASAALAAPNGPQSVVVERSVAAALMMFGGGLMVVLGLVAWMSGMDLQATPRGGEFSGAVVVAIGITLVAAGMPTPLPPIEGRRSR